MTRLRDLARALVLRVKENPAFAALFLAFTVAAYVVAARCPLGPGQDQHYHVMSASIAARWWTGDPEIRALYKFINPTDCNTLVYSLLFPFELVLDPVRAWRWGFTTYYFVGYPVACVVALRAMRRPLWGALLAFPLAYVKCWSQGGYMPFVSAGPFFILSLAGMHCILSDDFADRPRRSRRRILVLTAIACALVFFAHGHVFTWTMASLGTLTVVKLVGDLVPGIVTDPRAAVNRAFDRGATALLVVLPALLLFGLWYWRVHYGGNSTHETGYVPSVESMQIRVTSFPARFVHVVSDREWAYVPVLFGLVVFGIVLAGRPRARELLSPELVFGLTIASYFVLPFSVTGTDLGLRQPDMAVWTIPLIVYPRVLPHARWRHVLAIGAILAFTVSRYAFLEEHLVRLNREMRGLFQMAKPCPAAPAEIAYATYGGFWSKEWEAPTYHQAHETLAALCRFDTPVYDPTEYPHNMLPVRYRGKPPSPITILHDHPRWYLQPNLWKDFELVLVRNWHPMPSELEEVSTRANRIRQWGEWELWRRKPDLANVR